MLPAELGLTLGLSAAHRDRDAGQEGLCAPGDVEVCSVIALEQVRVFLDRAADLAPEEFLEVGFRWGRSRVRLRIEETLEPPDRDPGRCMGLACGVRALGNRNGVIPHALHQGLDILRKCLAENGLAETDRIRLVAGEVRRTILVKQIAELI